MADDQTASTEAVDMAISDGDQAAVRKAFSDAMNLAAKTARSLGDRIETWECKPSPSDALRSFALMLEASSGE